MESLNFPFCGHLLDIFDRQNRQVYVFADLAVKNDRYTED
jgi:hypothetical protein